MESNGTGNAVSSTDIWTWVLRNPDTGARFYTTQQAISSSRDITTFSAYLNTSFGVITVPNVQLNGRQSKILVTDYNYGGLQNLLYSSADILTHGTFDQPVLVMYADVGQISEFAFQGSRSQRMSFKTYGKTRVDQSIVQLNQSSGQLNNLTKYTYTQVAGSTAVKFAGGPLVYLLDTETAWNFFAPPTTTNPNVAPTEQVFVLGPYNVRNVTVSDGVVILLGDNANVTSIEVYAEPSVHAIVWNGQTLKSNSTAYGSLTGTTPGAENRTVNLPTLSWISANGLPETDRNYDDSKWKVCNKTTTLSPVPPLTLPVLFSSDYGYYSGVKIYRGYFDGSQAQSANVTAQNGLASGWSAWLNGKLVGGFPGNASLSASSDVLDFSGVELYNTSNVLTVVTDYTGHDETSTGPVGAENPRGLLGAQLIGANGTTLNFKTWKIQGNAGGSANIDPVRGPMNEGGLHGERLGWVSSQDTPCREYRSLTSNSIYPALLPPVPTGPVARLWSVSTLVA